MIRVQRIAAVVALLLGLTACAEDLSVAPTHKSSTEGKTPVAAELTWQEAKARTQAMELEIVNSIPKEKVAKVDQLPTGVLIDCSDTLVNWHGATTVTLTAGTEPEPFVREVEAKYRDSRFNIKTRDPAPAGHYEVQLRSPDTAEMYIIGAGGDPHTIRIASGSECFTWVDDGKFKGGDF